MLSKECCVSLGLVAMLLFQSGFCSRAPEREMTPIAIFEGDKSLLIFFNKGISSNFPYEYSQNVLAVPREDGKGSTVLSGIEMNFALDPVDGHKGVGVKLRDNISDEDEAFIRKRVTESSGVFRVFHNVTPESVVTLY